MCVSVSTSASSVYMHKMYICLHERVRFDVAYSKNGIARGKKNYQKKSCTRMKNRLSNQLLLPAAPHTLHHQSLEQGETFKRRLGLGEKSEQRRREWKKGIFYIIMLFLHMRNVKNESRVKVGVGRVISDIL